MQRDTKYACGDNCPRCTEEASIQPQLRIGSPTDRYEHEADAVADRVVIAPTPVRHPASISSIEDEAADGLRSNEHEPAAGRDQANIAVAENRFDGPRTSGALKASRPVETDRPLPNHVRSFYESRFGHDFSSNQRRIVSRRLTPPAPFYPSGMSVTIPIRTSLLDGDRDVEMLALRDNHIEDNGPDAVEPVCGVFILQAEGAEIDRNRILNNGERTAETPDNAKRGPRAGIWITLAQAPMQPLETDFAINMVQLEAAAVGAGGGDVRIRYLGNASTLELHDRDKAKPQCRLDGIRTADRRPYKTQKAALADGFDFCVYCFGRDRSNR